MKSKLLTANGISHYLAGRGEANFKAETAGDQLIPSYQWIEKQLESTPQALYTARQVHGNRVIYCDGNNGEQMPWGRLAGDADGLITDRPGIALLVKFADCTPVVLYDTQRKVLSIVHSGWRGTVQRIAQQAYDQMVNEFGCQLKDMIAYIGPSIDQANYQVGREVYEAFDDFSERDAFIVPDDEGRYRLSMIDANRSILTELGFSQEQIEVASQSTYTTPSLHSCRRDSPQFGLNALAVMMPIE